MLIIMAGLPGTGKSTLARALAARSGGIVLDKDLIRAALFPGHLEYSLEQDDFCQQIMLQVAGYLLSRNPSLRVFLDGRPFSRRYQRRQVESAAARLRTPLAIIECVCGDAAALARLQSDAAAGVHPAADRDAALYARVKTAFEAFEEPRLTLDTSRPLAECLRQADTYLEVAYQQFPSP